MLLSAFVDPAVLAAGVDVGIAGCCRKDIGVDAITKVVEQVQPGRSSSTRSCCAAAHPQPNTGAGRNPLMAHYLTRRGQHGGVVDVGIAGHRVLARLAAGQTATRIATTMGVTRSTDRTHGSPDQTRRPLQAEGPWSPPPGPTSGSPAR